MTSPSHESAQARRAWAERTVAALQQRYGSLSGMTFEVHAGAAYRLAIDQALARLGARIEAPLSSLAIGEQLTWYAKHVGSPSPHAEAERRRTAARREVHRALQALDGSPVRIGARDWPGDLKHLDDPGLYSWWVDRDGARELSQGLGEALSQGRIYAGQTGATKWPSGKTGAMTLAKRVGRNHLRGTIRGSTFRLTLAAILRQPLALVVLAPRRLNTASEQRLNDWICEHLDVAVHPFPHPDALTDLEHKVLAVLNPPLNIDQMPPTSLRATASSLRASLHQDPPQLSPQELS